MNLHQISSSGARSPRARQLACHTAKGLGATKSIRPTLLIALGCGLVWAPISLAQDAPISPAPLAPAPLAPAPLAPAVPAPLAPVAPALPAPVVPAPIAPVAPVRASGASAPVAVPVPTDISVLIVALDDLGLVPASAIPAYAPPIVPVPDAPLVPIVPADGMPLATTPASLRGYRAPGERAPFALTHTELEQDGLWPAQWRALAQKKPKKTKEEKRREKAEAEAKLFNLDPDPASTYKKPGATDPADTAPIVRGPGSMLPGSPGAVVGAPAPAPYVPPVPGAPGRSQLMALVVRRNLLAQGYKEVQVATPDSNSIVRARIEGRLSDRVIDELKRSLATLATSGDGPTDIGATIAAGRAAARIGQATGYRAVIGFYVGAPALISVVGAGSAPDATTQKVAVNMVISDAQRESVEPLRFVETGDSEAIWSEIGGATGAGRLDATLHDWPATSSENRPQMAQVHFAAAQAAFEANDLARAQDELNQSLSLDGTHSASYVLRGDILNASGAPGAALAYQRAVEINSNDGQDWAAIAAAYAGATPPDFPAARSAAERALALNYDSAALRVTLASVQYGRAELFRRADYLGRAEEAEADARMHLERALQLAPDDPTAMRLLSTNLLAKRRYEEAARTLDRIAPRFPNDADIQRQYATALANQVGREEDAFAAYSKLWKLTGVTEFSADPLLYRSLATGFDQRLYNLGRVALQLSRGVAQRAILRETALIQLTKLKEEMDNAQAGIAILRPTGGVSATAAASRVFAADLMDQSLESFQSYLDTGQIAYFERGDGLYRDAVTQLNTARASQ